MSISFEGIGSEVITVKKNVALKKGDLCCFSGNLTVSPATSGSAFQGKVLEIYDDGTASVQIHGYMELHYASNAAFTGYGYQGISCTSATIIHNDNAGRQYLVVSIDTSKKTVGIML